MQFNDDIVLSANVNMSSSEIQIGHCEPLSGRATVEMVSVCLVENAVHQTVKHGSKSVLAFLFSVSPTAARYLSGRLCVSRLPCASRRGTAKYVGTPEWRKGSSATPGSSTSTTTPAANLTANSKTVCSAGMKF